VKDPAAAAPAAAAERPQAAAAPSAAPMAPLAGVELTSQPSAKTQKALYNEIKKACKSRNIGCKVQSGSSFICETTLSGKTPVKFSLVVEKFGDVKGCMHILKAALMAGSKEDMQRVCKAIFNAVGNSR
jgi:hypothetical protein